MSGLRRNYKLRRPFSIIYSILSFIYYLAKLLATADFTILSQTFNYYRADIYCKFLQRFL